MFFSKSSAIPTLSVSAVFQFSFLFFLVDAVLKTRFDLLAMAKLLPVQPKRIGK